MSRVFDPSNDEDSAVLKTIIRINPEIELELSFDHGNTWSDRQSNVNRDGTFRAFDLYFMYRIKEQSHG